MCHNGVGCVVCMRNHYGQLSETARRPNKTKTNMYAYMCVCACKYIYYKAYLICFVFWLIICSALNLTYRGGEWHSS